MTNQSDIAVEILNYLLKHPEANDTLEGITEWWLLNQRISYEMKRVKAAITKLIKEGWVIEFRGRNSLARYRLNPERSCKKK